MVLLCMNCVGRSLPISAECVSANSCEWLDFPFLRHRIQEEAKPTCSINATKDGGCFWPAFRVRFVLFLFGSYVCCKQKNLSASIKIGETSLRIRRLTCYSALCRASSPWTCRREEGFERNGHKLEWSNDLGFSYCVFAYCQACSIWDTYRGPLRPNKLE